MSSPSFRKWRKIKLSQPEGSDLEKEVPVCALWGLTISKASNGWLMLGGCARENSRGCKPTAHHRLLRLKDEKGHVEFIKISGAFWKRSKDAETVKSAGELHPKSRWNHSAVSVNSWLVIYGGFDGKEYLDDCWLLDTRSLAWTKPETSSFGPMMPRERHASFVFQGLMITFGGYGKHRTTGELKYFNDVYVFDTESHVWKRPYGEVGERPSPRAGMTASLIGHTAYIFGGCDANHVFDDLWLLEISKAPGSNVRLRWMRGPQPNEAPYPRPRHAHVAIPHGVMVFMFGGQTTGGRHLSCEHVWALNTRSLTWRRHVTDGDVPSPCSNHFAFMDQLYIYTFGGRSAHQRFGDLHRLDSVGLGQRWYVDPPPCTSQVHYADLIRLCGFDGYFLSLHAAIESKRVLDSDLVVLFPGCHPTPNTILVTKCLLVSSLPICVAHTLYRRPHRPPDGSDPPSNPPSEPPSNPHSDPRSDPPSNPHSVPPSVRPSDPHSFPPSNQPSDPHSDPPPALARDSAGSKGADPGPDPRLNAGLELALPPAVLAGWKLGDSADTAAVVHLKSLRGTLWDLHMELTATCSFVCGVYAESGRWCMLGCLVRGVSKVRTINAMAAGIVVTSPTKAKADTSKGASRSPVKKTVGKVSTAEVTPAQQGYREYGGINAAGVYVRGRFAGQVLACVVSGVRYGVSVEGRKCAARVTACDVGRCGVGVCVSYAGKARVEGCFVRNVETWGLWVVGARGKEGWVAGAVKSEKDDDGSGEAAVEVTQRGKGRPNRMGRCGWDALHVCARGSICVGAHPAPDLPYKSKSGPPVSPAYPRPRPPGHPASAATLARLKAESESSTLRKFAWGLEVSSDDLYRLSGSRWAW